MTNQSIFSNFYFVTFFVTTLAACYMYIFDWPQALSTKLQLQPYFYTLQKIDLLYTFTSVGVIVIIFKLGSIYDSISLKISLPLTIGIMMLGQFVTTILFYFYHSWSYYVIITVRVIFGIAGSSTFALQAIVCYKIYGKSAGRYIGYGNAISFLGSPINSLVNPILAGVYNNVTFPLFIGFCISLLYVIVTFIILKILSQNQKKLQEDGKPLLENDTTPISTPTDKQEHQQENSEEAQKNNQQAQPKDGLIKQIKQLKIEFWLLQILVFCNMSAASNYISIGIDYFVKRYNIRYELAGTLFVIPFFVGTLTSFVIWPYLKIKLRNCFILISSLLIIPHLVFYFMPSVMNSQPKNYQYIIYIICLTIIGLNVGGYLVKLIPAIYIVTKAQNSGAVTGLFLMCIHLSIISIPLISSFIIQSYSSKMVGYQNLSIILFLPISLVSAITSIYMRLTDNFLYLDKQSQEQLEKSMYKSGYRSKSIHDIDI